MNDTEFPFTVHAKKKTEGDSYRYINDNVNCSWSIKNLTESSKNTVDISSTNDYGTNRVTLTASGYSSDVYELTLTFGGITKNYYIRFQESTSSDSEE